MAKIKPIAKFIEEIDELQKIDVLKYSSEELNELNLKLINVQKTFEKCIKQVEYLKELKALKEKYNIKD